MPRFIFRMQSILGIKEKLEEQAKIDFAAALRVLEEEEGRLAVLFERKEAYLEEGRILRGDVLRVRDILDNKDYILTLDGYIDLQRLAIIRAEDAVERARMKMNEAIKERKTYERLREKAFEEHMREENAREAKESDELTSYKYAVRA